MKTISNYIKVAGGYGDVFFAVSVVFIISILLVPVSANIIDMLFSISVTLSIMILVTVLFIASALEFNSFPTILLVVTMLRLALNIASTRLILSDGHMGTYSAGSIIEAFGKFVMQGSLVIGIIVFIILTIINFVVITKGSSRIAEVSARFSLDSMPGKQMAIDADLASGSINENEAKIRRNKLEQESAFFGSMDGASKFVRGDAIAGILITFINFVAGMMIGMVQREMDFQSAAHTYTILTIGDGLISQIPALIVSIGAGMLVTKSLDSGSTDKAVFAQLSRYPRAIGLTSVFVLVVGLFPGMPVVPFLLLSILTSIAAYFIWKNQAMDKVLSEGQIKEPKKKDSENIEEIQLDHIKIELGGLLLSMIDIISAGVKKLRSQMANDLGFMIPSIRIQDNLNLPNAGYLIKINDIKCGQSEVRTNKLLVISPEGFDTSNLDGERTKEPSFGLDAMWIDHDQKSSAEKMNYTVVEPSMVIITHLTEIVKENITELLSYGATQKTIDDLGEEHKKLVSDTVPVKADLGVLHRVLQQLLSENISIKNIPMILEAVGECSGENIQSIIEKVRIKLSRQICASLVSDQGYIPVINISPDWEQSFAESLKDNIFSLAPSKTQEFVAKVGDAIRNCEYKNESPIILTSALIRPYVRIVLQRPYNHIAVLSQNEIHPRYTVKTLMVV